jgi:hypothetical protein
VNGHHRNLFIEGGMVSTVTTYHKGYSTTGNTNIIHRYLPKEIGELLVHYLWLVQPFCRKLEMLVLRRRELPSPFLRAKRGSLDPWDSSRLSRVLQSETKEAFGFTLKISIYMLERHEIRVVKHDNRLPSIGEHPRGSKIQD